MQQDDVSQDILFLVGNVPTNYRSYDLREFFIDFIENKAFSCFHFKHRPEHERTSKIQKHNNNSEHVTELDEALDDHSQQEGIENIKKSVSLKKASTLCCVVQVKQDYENEFITSYNGKKWMDRKGNHLPQKVKIARLNDTVTESSIGQRLTTDNQTIQTDVTDLLSLPELNPPNVMPQGNVGTPVSVFLELIKNCKLPCHVIKKLKLHFPIGKLKKRYGAVPMNYTIIDKQGITLSDMKIQYTQGNEECDYHTMKRITNRIDEGKEVEDIPSNGDYDAEEWERYEALHEDVDKQGRSEERLFENEMEVVWEKGGSGLVFYTDAKYWDEQDGDFDEQCSKEDDWDVDMSLYYGYNSADKTAVDMREMEIEKCLREGTDPRTSDTDKPAWIGEGFGGKILKRDGWKQGTGLGLSGTGISEPLQPEGQHPSCKKGFGYHGEKIIIGSSYSSTLNRKRTRDVSISTVYDRPIEEKDCVYKRAPPTSLKYRQKHIAKHIIHNN